jgi:methyl-galactoside transport system ATP-binding protein
MVHQELNQALKLSVMDNMWLGRFPRAHRLSPFVSDSECYRKTKEILERLSIDTDPREIMEGLSVSKRQMVEIAKAVSYDSKVIVFDEPTSSLNEREAETLFDVIKKLKDEGRAIIYISHKMEEILRISDDVTVMRDGKLIATRSARDITTDEIIKLMVGRELNDRYPSRSYSGGEVILSVKGLCGAHSHLKDADLELRRGEILGVAGLDGSGRTELVETLFGLREKSCGEIALNGRHVSISSPADAKRHGLAFYNFTESIEDIGLDFNVDTYDAGLHLNLAGAVKFSAYFADILAKDHGITDHRNDADIAAIYNEKLENYDNANKNGKV